MLDEVRDWQSRPLEAVYPIIFFDALRVKIRDEGLVKNKAVYVVLGVKSSGEKEVLGLWIEQTEGAKFWLKVMNDLKNRGVQDILIAVIDGLKGFPEAIGALLSADTGSDLHRASDPQQPFLRILERSQDDHAVDQGDLSRRERRGGAAEIGSSSKPNGASVIRRLAKPGGALGRKSFHSSPLRRRFAK